MASTMPDHPDDRERFEVNVGRSLPDALALALTEC